MEAIADKNKIILKVDLTPRQREVLVRWWPIELYQVYSAVEILTVKASNSDCSETGDVMVALPFVSRFDCTSKEGHSSTVPASR